MPRGENPPEGREIPAGDQMGVTVRRRDSSAIGPAFGGVGRGSSQADREGGALPEDLPPILVVLAVRIGGDKGRMLATILSAIAQSKCGARWRAEGLEVLIA